MRRRLQAVLAPRTPERRNGPRRGPPPQLWTDDEEGGGAARGAREVRETHDGLRAQERPLPGSVGAEPQGRLEAAARVSARVPSVAPPALAAQAAECVDTSTLRFLAKAALDEVRKLEEEAARRKVKEAEEAKAKEERLAKYEAKMHVINRRVRDGTATPAEGSGVAALDRHRAKLLLDLHCPKKKEEEEEEEKDEAASLIPLFPVGGFAGDDTTRAVFLVCLDAQDARLRLRFLLRPFVLSWLRFPGQMLRIMAGMNQKDSYAATQFGLFWEIPSWSVSYSAQCLVRQWILFFVSLRVGLVA